MNARENLTPEAKEAQAAIDEELAESHEEQVEASNM